MKNNTLVHKLTFNPFQENTFIVEDIHTKDCIIFDPGCLGPEEESALVSFIDSNDLQPRMLLNTHCHVDHIFGNAFVKRTYKLELLIPEADNVFIDRFKETCAIFHIPYVPTVPADRFLDLSQPLRFGENSFQLLHCPGHSPGSVCFYNVEDCYVIGGDVLFAQSIGRTDLYLGDHKTLITSIKEKLFVLPDDTVVHPGHGPSTTIGAEKRNNPFVRES